MNTLINRGKKPEDIAKTHFDSEKKEKARGKRNLDEFLIYASEEKVLNSSVGRMYLHPTGINKSSSINETGKIINDMCFHDGKLFYACGNMIYSLDSAGKEEIVKRRSGIVRALASHKGTLYDGGHYDGIYHTRAGGNFSDGYIFALCSHNNELYDAHMGKETRIVRESFTGNELLREITDVLALASHEDMLYYSYSNGAIAGLDFKNKQTIVTTTRNNRVHTLCSWNGKLLDGGDYKGIYDTKANRLFINKGKETTAMCTVPKEFVEGILKK